MILITTTNRTDPFASPRLCREKKQNVPPCGHYKLKENRTSPLPQKEAKGSKEWTLPIKGEPNSSLPQKEAKGSKEWSLPVTGETNSSLPQKKVPKSGHYQLKENQTRLCCKKKQKVPESGHYKGEPNRRHRLAWKRCRKCDFCLIYFIWFHLFVLSIFLMYI